MKTSLSKSETLLFKKKLKHSLKHSNDKIKRAYPGEYFSRQPVHTVYGGAHLFTHNITEKFKKAALAHFNEYAPTSGTLSKVLNDLSMSDHEWKLIHSRTIEKLSKEALEDFRIDFEDGYGNRSDDEEDSHAEGAAKELAKAMREGSLPPFIGIRIKSFSNECFQRSVRTLDLFLTSLLKETKIPDNFVITLPKITAKAHPALLTQILEKFEKKNKLKLGTLKFEIMVELPESILDQDGKCPLKSFVDAGKGRCVVAHFGTYDYTAACGITSSHQTMMHPVCDFAKHMMKVSLTNSGVMLSDGATNVMPVGPHKGQSHDPTKKGENEAVVYKAWRLSHKHIRHSLIGGFYQGWDLHPNQIPIRYVSMYAFFLENLEATTERLRLFIEKAARATLLGDVFDDAATGQGLLNFFLRGMSSGAISVDEALKTGLTVDEFESRSFLKILDGRKINVK